MKTKTIKAYGTNPENGKIYDLGDIVSMALRANMLVSDYKKDLVKANPQLNIVFKVEVSCGRYI